MQINMNAMATGPQKWPMHNSQLPCPSPQPPKGVGGLRGSEAPVYLHKKEGSQDFQRGGPTPLYLRQSSNNLMEIIFLAIIC